MQQILMFIGWIPLRLIIFFVYELELMQLQKDVSGFNDALEYTIYTKFCPHHFNRYLEM
jgi:hypothetical protein